MTASEDGAPSRPRLETRGSGEGATCSFFAFPNTSAGGSLSRPQKGAARQKQCAEGAPLDRVAEDREKRAEGL